MATIDAMFRPRSLGNVHPQCTFPARFSWLKKELDLDLNQLPEPDCESLDKWKAELNAHQVSLIFAAAYLNNPSSMFGHTFLRFDPPDNSESSLLMASSVNFAADTSDQEGMIHYIYKGLFGGFPATRTIGVFYKKFKTYADNESRDIWEYRLDLSPTELEMVVLHLWELKGKVFNYFYLDENCAYRVIALLEVAFPDLGLTDNYTIYTTPADTIRVLSEHGIIASKRYRASATKTFFHHASTLTADEKRVVIQIVQDDLPLESRRLLDLPEKRKALVLALASEYLSILINKDVLDRRKSPRLTHRLLTERARLSIPVTFDTVPEPSSSPDQGHRAHRLSLGGSHIESEYFYSIGYRDNYHSLLDPSDGFENGAQIEFLNLELRGSKETNIQLEQLTILNVTSLTPTNEFFRPASWSVSLGAKREYIDFKRPLVYSLESGGGMTYKIGQFLLSGMGHVSVATSSVFGNGYGLGTGLISRLIYQSARVSYDFGISTKKYWLSHQSSLHTLWGETSFALNNQNTIFLGVRLSLNSGSSNEEINLGIKHYF